MTEWPPADRLRDALDDIEHELEPAEVAWQNIQQRIAADAEAPLASAGHARSLTRGNVIARSLAAAAVILVLVVATFSREADQESGTTITADDGPALQPAGTPSVTATEQPPVVPELVASGSGCADIEWGRYRVVGDADETVVWAGGIANLLPPRAVVHFTDGDVDELVGRVDLAPDIDASELTLVANPGEVTPRELLEALADRLCIGALPLLVIDGTAAADVIGVFCESPPLGPGWDAYALIETDFAPPGCAGLQPTLLVDGRSHDHPILQAWVRAHQCGAATSSVDAAGNTITDWSGCSATLRHVQTTEGDPWLATVDEASLIDVVRSLFDLPK